MNVNEIITLSNLLAEMGHIKRTTKLPNHEDESDSHHSFSLALIAYQLVLAECPELDANKVLLFALCHDLLEIITGDEVTLHYTAEQHRAKYEREKKAIEEFNQVFSKFPQLKKAMHDYEKLDTPEAATVFVLDKASTTWTHHSHQAEYARKLEINNKHDVQQWAIRQKQKFTERLIVQPPQKILDIFEDSFIELEKHYES